RLLGGSRPRGCAPILTSGRPGLRMNMASDSVSLPAIIVSHNTEQVLPACLASMKDAGLKIVAVDNASCDLSVRLAREAGAHITANEQNQGFGRAINQALDIAASEFCLIVNPDVAFDAEAPWQLLALIRAAPEAAMIAPKLIEPDGRAFALERSPINPAAPAPPAHAAACGLLSGAALLARRERLLEVGGF